MSSVDNTKDCLACRLISGFGLIAMGAYILSQSKNRRKIEMNTMRLLSGGIMFLGIARLSNASFLKSK
ncbi:PREDICTED: uncharacterized protein LOC108370938 [Rhagoletis zephyria]|uniref:uncharacterized protein LOC108370938 n=1 Tax=Rhagoletis zephyria TaxID=28612 RepID=UPI0008115EF9|nr:PREDICTED: uncharacterized protein LOC108370938 [Rhagoletis zephyria]XP_036329946.1 uncharacterized protein LOC118742087 [Rhagoletis pomonella]XP_036329954.1 uncharacterized protein LOC118742095 [Rhagoletis pomonella]